MNDAIRPLRIAALALLVLWTLGAVALGVMFTYGGDLLAAGLAAFSGSGEASQWGQRAVELMASFGALIVALLWLPGAAALVFFLIFAPRMGRFVGARFGNLLNRFNLKVLP